MTTSFRPAILGLSPIRLPDDRDRGAALRDRVGGSDVGQESGARGAGGAPAGRDDGGVESGSRRTARTRTSRIRRRCSPPRRPPIGARESSLRLLLAVAGGAEQAAGGDGQLLVEARCADDCVAGLTDGGTHLGFLGFLGIWRLLDCSSFREGSDVEGGLRGAKNAAPRRSVPRLLIHSGPWERTLPARVLPATPTAGSGSTASCVPGRRRPSTCCPTRYSADPSCSTICRSTRRPGGLRSFRLREHVDPLLRVVWADGAASGPGAGGAARGDPRDGPGPSGGAGGQGERVFRVGRDRRGARRHPRHRRHRRLRPEGSTSRIGCHARRRRSRRSSGSGSRRSARIDATTSCRPRRRCPPTTLRR